MELSDEEKRKALLAAQGVKGALDVDTLPAISETTEQMRTGSPRTPGFDEHTGRTMKDAPQWPQAEKDGDAFEQALAEKLQETTPANLDKSRAIDR